MKRFLLLGLLIMAVIPLANAQPQYSRYTAKYFFFNLHEGDTINIDKDDLVVGANLLVPANSVDSVYVSGDTITIDGFQTTPHAYGPGEAFGIGYNDKIRINKLQIAVAATKVKLILLRTLE